MRDGSRPARCGPVAVRTIRSCTRSTQSLAATGCFASTATRSCSRPAARTAVVSPTTDSSQSTTGRTSTAIRSRRTISETEVEPDQQEQAVCRTNRALAEATDDVFGATPGVSLVLRVLDNDRDPNCDPIASQPLAEGVWNAEWGTIALIEQNQAFQYVPPSTPVSFSFPYTLDDGNGGEATATSVCRCPLATTSRPA